MSVLGAIGCVYSFFRDLRTYTIGSSHSTDEQLLNYTLREPEAPKAFSREVQKCINERFSQLKNAYEAHLLSDADILRTATFIETSVLSSDTEYFKKSEQGAARTLFYQKGMAIFLANKSKARGLLDVWCPCKRVSSAVKIPLDRSQPCSMVAQGVNRKGIIPYVMLGHEISILQKVQGQAGIINMLASFLYRQTRSAVFLEYCPSDLKTIALGFGEVPKNTLRGYCVQLIEALQFLHSQGIIHGDLKVNNAFLSSDGVRMLLADFGYSFHKNASPESRPPFLEYGYGTLLHAAPELLVGDKATVDYEKAEIWSLGMLFYTAYLRRYPIWANLINLYYKKQISLEKVHSSIVECLEGFLKGQTFDPFVRLIYQMLHKDPLMRPSLAACLEYAQKFDVEAIEIAKKLGAYFKEYIGADAAYEVAEALLAIKKCYKADTSAKNEVTALCKMPIFSAIPLRGSNVLAFMFANYRYKRGIAFLLKNALFYEGWLKDLLPRNQDAVVTQEIYEVVVGLYKEVGSFYARLKAAQCGFTDAECLRIAIFATKGMDNKAGYYQAAHYGLPADIQYTGDHLYVRTTKTRAYGTSKRRIPGVALNVRDLEAPCKQVALLVNRTYKNDGTSEANRRFHYDLMCEEINLQKELYDLEPKGQGIWPVYDVCTYEKGDLNKVSVAEPFGVTLESLRATLDFDAFLEVARQIAIGLSKLHVNDMIHGDLDDTNVLVDPKSLFVGLIDFGFALKIDVPQKDLLGAFPLGYYGKIYPTAPELLGNTAFTGDYKAVEMWAFGYMLYMCLYNRTLPWDAILKPYVDRYFAPEQQRNANPKVEEPALPKSVRSEGAGTEVNHQCQGSENVPIPVSQVDMEKIKSCVLEVVELPALTRQLSHINFQSRLVESPQKMLEHLIKKCFSLEPERRPTSIEFVREIQKIQAARTQKK